MRILLITVLIFLNTNPALPQKKNHCRSHNKEFRAELIREFSDSAVSPLTAEDYAAFRSLPFFSVKCKYRVVAKLELTPEEQPFEMPRSKGNTGTYRKYGTAVFLLRGKECRLALYQSVKLMADPDHERYLFLPFSDLTNGKQTYAGGRFLDLEIPASGDSILIDFNRAYNPLCAYNHKYSCPLPPEENKLEIKVCAGVKLGIRKSRK